jgi:glycosyltransferase involved in cell wall biosynthesis
MRILLIGYHFPPIGGPAAQRALHFAQELRRAGHDVCVVTGAGRSHDPWAPPDDAAAEEVEGLDVLRFSSDDPPPRTGAGRALERLAAAPTRFEGWFARELDSMTAGLPWNPDVILGELVPYACATGIVRLQRRLDAPLVVDLHDPWALDEMWLYPTWAQRAIDRARMRKTLTASRAVAMNTAEAARRVKDAFPSLADRVAVIPSGYDATDFPREAAHPIREQNTYFRIVHTGSMHVGQGIRHMKTERIRKLLGGMPVSGAQFLSRSHYYLVKALRSLSYFDIETARSIELYFAGSFTDQDRQVAADIPRVHWLGYLSHQKSVELIRQADLLFLPMHDVPGRAGLVPTKTYEYLGSGRPILAAVPRGDARDLLEASGTAMVCAPTDSAGMARALTALVGAWKRRERPPNPDWSVVGRFEWAALAMEMNELLERVISGDST